jgi:GMP synthase (glutamine-hydrolysing)
MRFLIVQTGTTLPEIRARHGDFPQWIARDMELAPGEVHVVRVDRGEALPDPATVRGAVVTGSGAMVTDRESWSEATADWLRAGVASGLPLLGLCYGHQLLAHALGGCVDFNPRGREIGSAWLERSTAAVDDALFDRMPARFVAQESHLQSVVEAPPGSVVLARSARDRHQALRHAPRVWGLQFHPEFSEAVVALYISERADALRHEGLDPVALEAAVAPAPEARGLLARFAELARNAGRG